MQSALHESQVAEATDEFLEALRAGRHPDVEQFAARYPDVAQVLREMLPALAAVHDSRGDADATSGRAPLEVDESLQQLGDFRLIREVGRGGMGVVYEAWQQSLGRRVAIKVLPFAAALDPRQLQRFKNEAQAAAQLHHTHIVPVYAVGCERGVHYYAMQFIDGRTVGALLDELRHASGTPSSGRGTERDATLAEAPATPPVGRGSGSAAHDDSTRGMLQASTARQTRRQGYFRQVARLGAEAASALEHSHSLGIVHRDIKPGNLMIDVQGHLWVTDFGLAQFPSDSRLTMTGDLVGTLRYMSPEQLLGGRVPVDHRCDLYSLGATLYELMTLRPAVSGEDRQALLQQITFDDPPPARKIDRSIPAELETIVGKAMAKNPAERYATAQELVDDLERFLRNEPIRARRPTLAQRLQKWAARHRELVATAAVGSLVLFAAVAASAIWIAVTRQQALEQVQQAFHAESRAKTRAEEGFRQARQAVDTYLTNVADEALLHEPGMTELRDRLLTDALAYYTKFVEQEPASAEDRRELAMAHLRIGEIKNAQGQGDEALASYRQSEEQFALLLRQPEVRPEWLADAGMLQLSLGTLLASMGDAAAGRAAITQATEQLEASIRARPDTNARLELARAHHNVGWLAKETGDYLAAKQSLARARAISEELVRLEPENEHARMSLVSDHLESANLARLQGALADARDANARGLAILEHADDPDELSTNERMQLLLAYNNQGEVLFQLGEQPAARALFEKAREACRRLVDDEPHLSGPRMSLAGFLQNLAYLDHEDGRVDQACAGYREALLQFERLVQGDPRSWEKRLFAAQTAGNLTEAELRRRRPEAAQVSAEQALRFITEIEGGDDITQRRDLLAIAHCNLGRVHFALGRHDQACDAFVTARDTLKGHAAQLVRAAGEAIKAITVDAAGRETPPEPAERVAVIVVSFLTEARDADAASVAELAEKPEFAVLRERADFRAALGGGAAP